MSTDVKSDVRDGVFAKRMNRRNVIKLASIAGAGVAAAGLSSGAVGAAPATRGAVRNLLAQQGDAEQVFYDQDYHENPTSFDFNLNLYAGAPTNMVTGLLNFDENMVAVGDWAERWESNEDFSVYTFFIRPNNTGWSDGVAVTAHDFAWSFARQLDPATGAAYAGFLFDIKNAEAFNTGATADSDGTPFAAPLTAADLGIKAIDDWTLELTMQGSRGYFPQVVAYIAAVPARQDLVESLGDAWAVGGDNPVVSCGPFMCDVWDQGVMIEGVPNPGYWNVETINIDRVYHPIHPASNSLLMFEEGEGTESVDWTRLSSADYERFSADPELSALVQPFVYPGVWMLLPQVTMAPFDDIRVRTALSHAIDRSRIETISLGLLSPAACLVPPGVFGYLDDPGLADIQKFDPALAMEALVGTEFEGGQNWPEMTLYMRSNEEQYNADIMANDIVAQIQENLGWQIQIQIVPTANWTAQLNQLQWPLVMIRWWYDYPDPNNGYGDMFYSRKSAGRRQAWSNDEFDDLVIAGKEEGDNAKRLEIYHRCETIMQEDRGYIPLVYRTDMNVFKPWVKGLKANEGGFLVPNTNIYRNMISDVYIEGRE
jgi:ABC-type transport system substrate-binding protein